MRFLQAADGKPRVLRPASWQPCLFWETTCQFGMFSGNDWDIMVISDITNQHYPTFTNQKCQLNHRRWLGSTSVSAHPTSTQVTACTTSNGTTTLLRRNWRRRSSSQRRRRRPSGWNSGRRRWRKCRKRWKWRLLGRRRGNYGWSMVC